MKTNKKTTLSQLTNKPTTDKSVAKEITCPDGKTYTYDPEKMIQRVEENKCQMNLS